MIDTHCHLFDEEFDIDREDAIKRAIDSGVEKMILVGFSHKTNQLAQEMAKKWNVFYPTAGLHPSEASLNYLNDFLKFKSFVEKNKVYAVGECGLDYHWDITYKEEQKKLFRLAKSTTRNITTHVLPCRIICKNCYKFNIAT